MESSAASDSPQSFIADLNPEQLAELRRSLETGDLSVVEERIAWLVEQSKVPTSLALGMRLAVAMTIELRDGVPLGSQSGILVSTWAVDYPETTEEAIQVAREFLLHPDTLAKELALRLFPSTGEE